jgi:hypothetical protein
MASRADTLTAGEAKTSPFRVTRPSAIIASTSRREAIPARAITLAMRSSAGSAAAGSCGSLPCAGGKRLCGAVAWARLRSSLLSSVIRGR